MQQGNSYLEHGTAWVLYTCQLLISGKLEFGSLRGMARTKIVNKS